MMFAIFCWVLLFPVFIHSQVHQLYIESMGDCDTKERLIDFSTLKISRLNRTTFTFKGSFKFEKDMPSDTTVKIALDKQGAHKAWQPTMLDSGDNDACSFVETDRYVIPLINQNSDLPKKCPYLKGEYHFHDANLKIDLPPFMKPGCWKVKAYLKSDSEKISQCSYIITKIVRGNVGPYPRCS